MSDTSDEIEAEEEGEAEAAAPEAAPEPRANPELVGHEAAEAALLAAWAAGKLPHALIIGGPRGIGKATLAFRLARFLLAAGAPTGAPGLFAAPAALFAAPAALAAAPAARGLALAADHPVFRRVAAGGHADLLTVERGRDKHERLRGGIIVEDARAVAGFLRLTPAEGGWRIVVVDGADDMNRNAANALLKILEEPPQRSLLLLVSHNPGRLLPTIRSRCRRLPLRPLPGAVVADLVGRYRPDLAAAEARMLVRLAEGSLGRALALAAAGGLDLYRGIVNLLDRLPELDIPAVHALADRLARADAEPAYRTMGELLTQYLARMIEIAARGGAAAPGGEALRGEGEGMRRLAARRGLDQWVEVWEKITRLFAQADSLNLDRKQVVLGAFLALEGAAR